MAAALRRLIWVFALAPCAVHAGSPATEQFAKVPFEDWLAGGEGVRFKWTARVDPPALSFHQRLLSSVRLKLDGKDLAPRRGPGELHFYIQITDSEGRTYRSYDSINLESLDANIKAADLEYLQSAFFLPGEYRLAAAIYDVERGEHSVRKSVFRVAPLKADLLPDLWAGLPRVEFLGRQDAPEVWFLPDVKGRLAPLTGLKQNATLDVILVLSPGQRVPGSGRLQGGYASLQALVPTLKAMGEFGGQSLRVNIEIIDLARHRVALNESDVRGLDWNRLKRALADADTAKIDVKALEERHRNAAFFGEEVSRVVNRTAEGPRAVLVLASPSTFPAGEEPSALAGGPETHAVPLFYFRYELPRPPFVRRGPAGLPPWNRFPRPDFGMRLPEPVQDQLEPLIAPLKPEVYDVETPEQVRKALAAVLSKFM